MNKIENINVQPEFITRNLAIMIGFDLSHLDSRGKEPHIHLTKKLPRDPAQWTSKHRRTARTTYDEQCKKIVAAYYHYSDTGEVAVEVLGIAKGERGRHQFLLKHTATGTIALLHSLKRIVKVKPAFWASKMRDLRRQRQAEANGLTDEALANKLGYDLATLRRSIRRQLPWPVDDNYLGRLI